MARPSLSAGPDQVEPATGAVGAGEGLVAPAVRDLAQSVRGIVCVAVGQQQRGITRHVSGGG